MLHLMRASSRFRTSGTAAGFTLLEVVIALAILGIGLGVVLPGIGLSLRLRQNAAVEARMGLAAEQVLGDLSQRTKPLEGAEEGEIDGIAWVIEHVATREAGGSVTGAAHGAELDTVRLSLTVPGGPRWEFTTLLPRAKPEVAQ